MRLYTTIKTLEIELLNWSIIKSNRENLRYNNDSTRFLVAFNAEDAEYFERFNGVPVMTREQALELMNTPDWHTEDQDS